MSLNLRQYIAKLSLLLVILAMGGDAVLPYVIESSCEHHHTAELEAHQVACSCSDHFHNHGAALEPKCVCTTAMDAVRYVVTLSSDSQQRTHTAKIHQLIATLLCVDSSSQPESLSEAILVREVTPLHGRFVGSITSLRAPPVLS